MGSVEPPHLTPRLVILDPRQRNDLLLLREPRRLRRRRTREEEYQDPDHERQRAVKDEQGLPAEIRGRLQNAPREEAAEDGRPSGCDVPEGRPRDLLGFGVEGARDVHDGRGGADFDGAEEEAHGGEAGEVVAEGVQGDDDAPEHAHDSEVLGQVDTLH